ncbi:glycosyltransferase family 1 protein [Pseudomaricurvus alcaniphilus]|uniref:alpha-glucan family phosphorylase n=1 Tax=Pseudomaricurvus alcaniphilus TaxID=1166482 RepID=UPI001407C833|nr:alpha-glucan family phosphorylase [Pseudomaricurvus alcaniphilus]NHN35777.1 glycosyltransferase family 1 protein [Pseudomaricurvus alcaniphilus]
MQSQHYFPRALPEPLRGLATLALDLRWSWNHGADTLWYQVAPQLWDETANPWLILETVSDHRLQILASDKVFLRQLQLQLDSRAAHHSAAKSWFSETIDGDFVGSIAYFSMEFGICESLPIYSGGLGVLAGDYLKTGCDLNVPLIGVGLLYQQGYFRQTLNAAGEQIEFYPYNDPTMLPVVPLRDDSGEWVHVVLDLPGRRLRLRTWLGQVGRRTLLLLDSNDPLNDPGDRGITSELYGGGEEKRLQQEFVLGIGGWRLLDLLGLDCPVCHLNEGHAAFAILERARSLMSSSGQPFPVALRTIRAGTLFTTHTPVEAGFDRFKPEVFSLYFGQMADELGVSVDELLALGRLNPDDHSEPFNMAYLAVRGSAAVNGVSRLHGEVSRRIFQPLFPHWPQAEVPVGYVTNGIHVPSWDSAAADRLWTDACGKSRWCGELDSVEMKLRQLGDEKLWDLRAAGRQRLIDFLRMRLVRKHRRSGATEERIRCCAEVLDPDILTLGFARRFAEYKRPNLLLHNQQRLLRLLSNRDHPVQLVIAGKAHPRDAIGKGMLRQWHQFIEHNNMHERVVFVEDYDLGVAEELIQGVDVWLNTPRRPWEASGTSGMKVLVNGGLNLSELDGWWAEAYAPELGWAIGDGLEHADTAAWDTQEAEQLFQVLEAEVIPCFYRRDEKGLATDWVKRMRASMATLTLQYSTNRMLREYTDKYYMPLAAAYRTRSSEPNIAVELETWQDTLNQHWQRLHFGNVTTHWEEGEHHFEVQVYLGDIPVEWVSVELYADAIPGSTALQLKLRRGSALSGTANAWVYHGSVSAERPAEHFTPRIIAAHPQAHIPLEANQILWFQ